MSVFEANLNAASLAIGQLSPPGDRARLDLYLSAFLADTRRRYRSNPHLTPLLGRLSEFLLSGGKRLRPRLCLASYRILSGTSGSPPRPVWLASASLEVLHSFMLVHDDLIDDSVTRRDRPTLHEAVRLDLAEPASGSHRKCAADLALVGGDLLCALGMQLINRSRLDEMVLSRVHRLVSEMLLETGLGEALDVLYGHCSLDDLTEDQLVEAYLRKTSRYSVSGPLVLGATMAGASPSTMQALNRFGDLLGFAFQVQNDLDALARDPRHGDHSDLDTGKRTFVLWLAYRSSTDFARKAIQEALMMPAGLERRRRLMGLIEDSGALEHCGARLDRIRRDSLEVLRDSPLQPGQRRAFSELMELFQLKKPSLPEPSPTVVPFSVSPAGVNAS